MKHTIALQRVVGTEKGLTSAEKCRGSYRGEDVRKVLVIRNFLKVYVDKSFKVYVPTLGRDSRFHEFTGMACPAFNLAEDIFTKVGLGGVSPSRRSVKILGPTLGLPSPVSGQSWSGSKALAWVGLGLEP
ncbi:hypothetical protein B0H13DRAFT_1865948 [Mycena leptocephala]|nr:hypothetical protein B0H13DRAFT_1865948 [Mycena leptocephala]